MEITNLRYHLASPIEGGGYTPPPKIPWKSLIVLLTLIAVLVYLHAPKKKYEVEGTTDKETLPPSGRTLGPIDQSGSEHPR